jgi:hypothetical protein
MVDEENIQKRITSFYKDLAQTNSIFVPFNKKFVTSMYNTKTKKKKKKEEEEANDVLVFFFFPDFVYYANVTISY